MKSGFSLIEIAIVIAIMGALMAIAIGGYRYLDNTKISATESKLSSLAMEIERYKNKIGEFPSDLNELITGPSNAQLKRKWSGSTMKESDLEDSWSNPFVYSKSPKGTNPPYELYSLGKPGSDVAIYAQNL